jgi:hypothetical protein
MATQRRRDTEKIKRNDPSVPLVGKTEESPLFPFGSLCVSAPLL